MEKPSLVWAESALDAKSLTPSMMSSSPFPGQSPCAPRNHSSTPLRISRRPYRETLAHVLGNGPEGGPGATPGRHVGHVDDEQGPGVVCGRGDGHQCRERRDAATTN